MTTENTNLPKFADEPAPKGEQVNTLPDTDRSVDEVKPGQKPLENHHEPAPGATQAILDAPGRVGPGTGDGVDTRALGDPNAPQGTGPDEVPGGTITAPAAERPAPAGEVRTSWAESGDYKQ